MTQCFVCTGEWNVEHGHFDGMPDWDLVCSNLEDLLTYKPNPSLDHPRSLSLSVDKFFSSVPVFTVGREVGSVNHVILPDDEVSDDTVMSMLCIRLDESIRHNVVL